MVTAQDHAYCEEFWLVAPRCQLTAVEGSREGTMGFVSTKERTGAFDVPQEANLYQLSGFHPLDP
jgi:hypothetical protein